MPLNLRPFPRNYLPLQLFIELKSSIDNEKFALARQRIASEDSKIQFVIDLESGLTILCATSEEHLKAVTGSLRNAGIAIDVGAPQVAYREIPTAPSEVDYTHKKQLNDTGEFARVKLRFEPNSRSMSNTFLNSASPDAVPAKYVTGAERGFHVVVRTGPLIGSPVMACRATLLDGAWHDVDSSELAFEIAARAAFREAIASMAMKLLEPYLEVSITVPEPFAAAVISDFKSRRGVNTAKEVSPGVIAIYGFIPLANAIGYEAHLGSITQGSASYSWKLAGLEEVPMDGGDAPFTSAAALKR